MERNKIKTSIDFFEKQNQLLNCYKTVPKKTIDGNVFEIIFPYPHTSMSVHIIGVVKQDCYPSLSFPPC